MRVILLFVACGSMACTATTRASLPLSPADVARLNAKVRGHEVRLRVAPYPGARICEPGFANEFSCVGRPTLREVEALDLRLEPTGAGWTDRSAPTWASLSDVRDVTWRGDYGRPIGALHGGGLGLLIGASAGGLIGLVVDPPLGGFVSPDMRRKTIIGSALLLGGLGLLSGSIAGAIAGAHDRIEFR